MQHDMIHLLIPPGMWRDDRGNGTKLHCVISISGTLMHLEAIQVHYAGNVQASVNEDLADEFTSISRLGSEGTFDVTEINGKSYVLVATPFT